MYAEGAGPQHLHVGLRGVRVSDGAGGQSLAVVVDDLAADAFAVAQRRHQVCHPLLVHAIAAAAVVGKQKVVFLLDLKRRGLMLVVVCQCAALLVGGKAANVIEAPGEQLRVADPLGVSLHRDLQRIENIQKILERDLHFALFPFLDRAPVPTEAFRQGTLRNPCVLTRCSDCLCHAYSMFDHTFQLPFF